MIRPSVELAEVYLCVEPVDFRKQINGLAALVQDVLALNPFSATLFVFTNKRRDRVRILVWERNGFVLWMKRLERERFHWPRANGKRSTNCV
jgi:transposase